MAETPNRPTKFSVCVVDTVVTTRQYYMYTYGQAPSFPSPQSDTLTHVTSRV